jgi:hypothetical protein
VTVKTHTTIPVPEIFAWSSDASNPVGTEYVIMEKAPGIQLFKLWDTMGDYSRLLLIEQLTKLENEFASIQFPAYGSLYLSSSSIANSERTPLPSDIDPSNSYFVGPSCDRTWLVNSSTESSKGDFSTGPCKESSSDV